MKKLIVLLLLASPCFAQTFSGMAGDTIRITPPFKACFGVDNGQDACMVQSAVNTVKMNGFFDFAFVPKTVATLPAAAANIGRTFRVTDGATAVDCTVGLGTSSVPCTSNGVSWVPLGGTGGSATPGGVNGNLQFNVAGTGFGGVSSWSTNGTTNINAANTAVLNLSAMAIANLTFPTCTANFFLAAPNGAPGSPTCRGLLAADVPVLNQSTTGQANTALALSATPTICGVGAAAGGVLANGNATGCFTPSGSFTPGANLAGSSTLQRVISIGPASGTASPLAIVDGTTIPNIAAAVTYLNGLGFGTSGTIWSMLPEDFTSDPFVNFRGTIILGHQTGTGNTCALPPNVNCYTTEVPMTLPTHLKVMGQGNASRTQSAYNSSTVINPGPNYPTKLGIPANATNWTGTGNHIPDFSCVATGGSLANGTYEVSVGEELDRTGGTGTFTPGFSSATYPINVSCANGGTSQSIKYHAPTASGSGSFIAKGVITYVGPKNVTMSAGSSVGESGTVRTVGGVTQTITCPGTSAALDPNYGCDFTSGFIIVTNVPVGKTGNPPPLVDLSTCMIGIGLGIPGPANVGAPNTFGNRIESLTLSGAMGGTNTSTPASNEPSCMLLGINDQEQSGPRDITFTGGPLNVNFYSGYKSGNSSASGLHMPSNDGPSPPAQGTVAAGGGFTFPVTQVNNTTGLYTGTFTGCAANACAGWRVNISGLANAINNLQNAEIVASSNTTLDFSTTTIAEVTAGSVQGLLFRGIIVDGRGEGNGGIRQLTDTTLAPRCSGGGSCANSPTNDHSVWLTGTAVSVSADSIHGENDANGEIFFADNLASLFVTNLTGFSDTGMCMVHASATADVVISLVGKDGKSNASICNDATGYTHTPVQNQGWNYANQYAIDNFSAPSGVTVGATAKWTSGAGAAAGNCTVGSLYTNTTAASASTVLYVCQPANTWSAVTVP